MIPTIETIVEDLLAEKITESQAISWLHQHAEDACRSLRDDFAAAALTGLMASLADPKNREIMANKGHGPDHAATACYDVADAMLKRRYK